MHSTADDEADVNLPFDPTREDVVKKTIEVPMDYRLRIIDRSNEAAAPRFSYAESRTRQDSARLPCRLRRYAR